MARNEERAAVLVRLDRDVEGPKPPPLRRSPRACPCRSAGETAAGWPPRSTTARLVSVCEATCPRLSPVTSASASSRRAISERDPQHHPPIENDRGGGATRVTISRCTSPNGTITVRASGWSYSGQAAHQIARLLLTGAIEVGHAVEMHEAHSTTPPHHARGRHGRIDAARQQSEPRRPDTPIGKPPGPATFSTE